MVVKRKSVRACIEHAFFVFLVLLSCTSRKDTPPEEITLIWKDQHATGLSFPANELTDDSDSLDRWVEVRLVMRKVQPAMLGELSVRDGRIIFEPLVPFTRGLRYEVLVKRHRIGEIEIPRSSEVPELFTVYPTGDTVPENLLKIYLHFSRPMREGQSLKYVTMVRDGGDTLRQVFLDLQPELWNKEGTLLTLWLDPGRIKRDLQPNRLLGVPLEKGKSYQLLVSSRWEDVNGVSLSKDYSRRFIAVVRDGLSPDPGQWRSKIPKAGTKQAFEMTFPESLDYVLLNEAVRIVDNTNKVIKGIVEVSDNEKKYRFLPEVPWKASTYNVEMEARLEDLAGNNLNRPFDRDLSKPGSVVSEKGVFQKEFIVQ